MDGTGSSGITIDWSKSQIFTIDFEWLGVGRVRYGVIINGTVYYVHYTNHANLIEGVYMTTPNLPIRYQVVSTGGTTTLTQICATVLTEGGQQDTGLLRSVNTGINYVTINAGNLTAMISIRLKPTHLDSVVMPTLVSAVSRDADSFVLAAFLNPTVAGTVTWVDLPYSPIQYLMGTATNTIAAALPSVSLIVSDVARGAAADVESTRWIGARINGTPEVLTFAIQPFSNGVFGMAITWKELA
jgi:hypothetical protein